MKGFIYVIRSDKTPYFYLGSTLQTLNSRFKQHQNSYKNYIQNKGNFCSSFEVLQFDDAYIEIQNEVDVNNKDELLKIEYQYFLDMREFLVNKNRPYDIDDERRITQKKYQDIYRKGLSIKNEISCPCCNQIIIIKVTPKIH